MRTIGNDPWHFLYEPGLTSNVIFRHDDGWERTVPGALIKKVVELARIEWLTRLQGTNNVPLRGLVSLTVQHDTWSIRYRDHMKGYASFSRGKNHNLLQIPAPFLLTIIEALVREEIDELTTNMKALQKWPWPRKRRNPKKNR